MLQQIPFFAFFMSITFAQECLIDPQAVRHSLTNSINPNDVEWTQLGNGDYETTIVFDAKTFDKTETGYPCTFTTRSHNDTHPSPTLIMQPGNTYHINFYNNLGPENMANLAKINNELRDPNTTNIHTHGIHVSGLQPSDSISVVIGPGEYYRYTYNIPCNHFGGIFWWHAHHHGSTSLHIAGSANGILLIEQPNNLYYKYYENIPYWLYSMDTIVLAVFYWDIQFNKGLRTNYEEVDELTSFIDDAECQNVDYVWYTINGIYQPTICLEAGKWKRLRLGWIEGEQHLELYLSDIDNTTDYSSNCELYLVAKDGHWLHSNTPRLVSHMFFSAAARADVLVNCVAVEGMDSYTIKLVDQDDILVSYIDVDGTDIQREFDLSDEEYKLNPTRSDYTPDLLNITNSTFENATKTVNVAATNINGIRYTNSTTFDEFLDLDEVYQWFLTRPSAREHPFHMHIFPFQIVEADFAETSTNVPQDWHIDGDYYDTWWFKGFMRFKTTTFGGTAAYHCHVSHHSDKGAIAVVQVVDGCDQDFNDFGTIGSCKIPSCPMNIPDRFECELTDTEYLLKDIEQCQNDPCDCNEIDLNCDTCIHGNGCQLCKDGYFHIDIDYKCHQCQKVFGDGCEECQDFDGCIKCADGYQKTYSSDCGLYYCLPRQPTGEPTEEPTEEPTYPPQQNLP